MDWVVRYAPVVLLGAVLAAAAAMTLILTSETTFFGDSWALLITRRDITVEGVLHPHNEHLIAIPALLEMLSLRLFGMDSARPDQVLLMLVLLSTAVLLFVYLARRVGRWLALFGVVVVLFLGPAWEVLLWPFEITFCGPVLFGLAMLLALEREDGVGDALACLFLTLSLGFSSLGVPFIAAAAVAVLLGPRGARLRRSYIFAVPALLFAAWYLGWGKDAESAIALRNILSSPQSVVDSAATAFGSLLGFVPLPAGPVPDMSWPRALLVAAVVVLAYRQIRRPGFSPGLWPVAAAAAATWFLTAFPGRDPTASRYQYAGAIFVLMILANLFSDVRPGRRGILVGAVVTALVVGPNLVLLKDGSRILERGALLARSDTAAIEIARRTVDPIFQLTPEIAGTPTLINIYAAEYLEAVGEYGSPAYSVEELRAAPEEGRAQADLVLDEALPVETDGLPRGHGPPGGLSCVAIDERSSKAEITLDPGPVWVLLPPGPPAELRLRRFAVERYPVALGEARGGRVTLVRIPRDTAPQVPWRLLLEARQAARVCQQ